MAHSGRGKIIKLSGAAATVMGAVRAVASTYPNQNFRMVHRGDGVHLVELDLLYSVVATSCRSADPREGLRTNSRAFRHGEMGNVKGKPEASIHGMGVDKVLGAPT